MQQKKWVPNMVRLKNIRIENGMAEAVFYPEDSKVAGHIVVDLESETVVFCKSVPGFGESYEGHAKLHLIRMAEQKATDTERLVMWC